MVRVLGDALRRSMTLSQLRSSPKVLSASEIRKSFLDYFCENHNHLYIRSSPVFSIKDPTLAFTNAGMNQFKEVFLGSVQPASNRVANSQKCIRVGGVHNDLSQVGQDGSHHTFFEMLGNWSFGDYFKEEACRMSWTLLTEVYGIPPERLYVTYFGGDDALGLTADVEVQEIWRKIGVKDTHILSFGAKDNFWTGNLTGPCGPCTEIHYDHCPGRTDAGNLVNSGSAEVTELWNLVFTEYDRKSTGELISLNKRFVDTGMGLERLVAVLQGKTSNYDTDLFLPLFEVIRKHTGHSGYTGNYDGNALDCGYRVLADHSRMITVALSDGMIPNHNYKVRHIIRKALTVAEKIFNAQSDLLKELTSHVAEILSDTYPETGKNLSKVHYIIDMEETREQTSKQNILGRWKKVKEFYPFVSESDVLETPQIIEGLQYITKNILKQGKKRLSCEDAFFLYDSLGVPVEVTADLSLKLGLAFDTADYADYKSSQKNIVKTYSHEKYTKELFKYVNSDVLKNLTDRKVQSTSDYFKHDYRVDATGKYVFKNQETTIESIICGGNLLDEISAKDIKDGEEVGLVLDRTQLFPEEGGQESDRGVLELENKITFDITRVIKIKDFVIHFGYFKDFPSDLKVAIQDVGVIKVDENRRLAIMRNHSALHLLNAAIRDEVYIAAEKFSEVTPDKLTLKVMLYKDNLHLIEGIQNLENYIRDFILHGTSVNRKILNHSQFQALNDVVFIPGEPIVEREIPVIEMNSGFKLSREYCTGAHVLNTSDLKDFIILKYKKGSYSIHEVTAVTGEKCSEIRKTDAEFLERFTGLEMEIAKSARLHPSEVQVLFSKLKQISSELSDSSEISHITRMKLLSAVKEANNNLHSFNKLSVRNFLREEIKKACEASSEIFVVHCLDRCWTFDAEDVEIAAESFQEKPLLIFLKRNNSIAVQCIVPHNFVSNVFSARRWLMDSLLPVGGIGRCRKGKNPDVTYFMDERTVTEEQLQRIMDNAVDIAKKTVEECL